MVADHHAHAQLARAGHGRRIGNTAIHGKQHIHTRRGQLLHMLHIKAVPLGLTVRQMPFHRKAVVVQHLHDQSRSRYAVHIVVAPHGEAFARQQALHQQIRRRAHPRPGRGAGQMPQHGAEKQAHVVRIIQIASPQN